MSTNEVSDILTMAHCIEEANVYGVQIPGSCLFCLLCSLSLIKPFTTYVPFVRYRSIITDDVSLSFNRSGGEGWDGCYNTKGRSPV